MTLKEACAKYNLDYSQALIMFEVLKHQDKGSLDRLIELDLDEEFKLYRINLLEEVNGEWVCKYPLEESQYKKFKSLINDSLNSAGHPDNLMNYTVIEFNHSVEQKFNELIKDYTLENIVDTIVKYYETGDYKKKLVNYIDIIESDLKQKTSNNGFTNYR